MGVRDFIKEYAGIDLDAVASVGVGEALGAIPGALKAIGRDADRWLDAEIERERKLLSGARARGEGPMWPTTPISGLSPVAIAGEPESHAPVAGTEGLLEQSGPTSSSIEEEGYLVGGPAKKGGGKARAGLYSVSGVMDPFGEAGRAASKRSGVESGRRLQAAENLRIKSLMESTQFANKQLGKLYTRALNLKESVGVNRTKLKKAHDRTAETMDEVRALLKKGVSYENAYKRMGKTRQALIGISAVIGGFFEGISGGRAKNMVYKTLDAAIARDVADQASTLKSHMKLLGLDAAQEAKLKGELDDRLKQHRAAMASIAKMELYKIAAKDGSARAFEALAKAGADIGTKHIKSYLSASPRVKATGRLPKPKGGVVSTPKVAGLGGIRGAIAAESATLKSGASPSAQRTAVAKYGVGATPKSRLYSKAVVERYAKYAVDAQKDKWLDPSAKAAQYSMYGHVPYAYARQGKKLVITRPGWINIAGQKFKVGQAGYSLEKYRSTGTGERKELNNAMSIGAGMFSRVEDIAKNRLKSLGAGKDQLFDLGDYLKGMIPYFPEFFDGEIAKGLGVAQAVEVQGSRPAREEQAIFIKWQIKPGDTPKQVRRKVIGMVNQLGRLLKSRANTYSPEKYDNARSFLHYNAALNGFRSTMIKAILGAKRGRKISDSFVN